MPMLADAKRAQVVCAYGRAAHPRPGSSARRGDGYRLLVDRHHTTSPPALPSARSAAFARVDGPARSTGSEGELRRAGHASKTAGKSKQAGAR